MSLTLAPGLLEEVVEYSRSCLPQEGCGLIAGRNGSGTRFVPVTNILSSDSTFEMDAMELISALRSFREKGEDLVAIFHSHPHGSAEPSIRDVERAYYPEAAHLIVSLEDSRKPVARAFRIAGSRAVEVELRVIV